MSTDPEIMYFAQRCRLCGACVETCPEGAHVLSAGSSAGGTAGLAGTAGPADSYTPAITRHDFDRSRCRYHYRCVEACPFGALQVSLRRMSAGQVLETVLRDAAYYRNSGGGLTLSGGEPLLQLEFSGALLQEARRQGIHTAVDTCLHASWAAVEALIGVVDLWLVDLKLIDPQRHERQTGVSNTRILQNLEKLAAHSGHSGSELWIRMPLIEGVNADPENLEATVALITKLKGVSLVELLPYHSLGVDKRESLGEASPERFSAPAAEVIEGLAARMRAHGLEVRYRAGEPANPGAQQGECA